MTRIRLRAQRRILWLRTFWSSSGPDEMQGLAITHHEVDRILDNPQQCANAESAFYSIDEHALQLSKRIDAIEQVFANDGRWAKLCQAFSLSVQEIDLLTLAVAVEIDPMLRRVYGYVQDDASASFPPRRWPRPSSSGYFATALVQNCRWYAGTWPGRWKE